MPVTRISPQQQLIAFVVERLDVPRRSELAGEARPVIIAIAIDHSATRSQDAAVVKWPSSRKSVAHQRCLRCMTGLAAFASIAHTWQYRAGVRACEAWLGFDAGLGGLANSARVLFSVRGVTDKIDYE